MIVLAAILKDGVIYTGIRHHLIMWAHPKGMFKGEESIQGFITDTGEFKTREESLVIARACGQVYQLIGGVLTSEDLWDINGIMYRKV